MNKSTSKNIPLAARMRPQNLEEYVGQKHLVGKNKPIRKLVEKDDLVSLIFWGPPGSGKTTLAQIIANETNARFVRLSAVNAGKSDVRKVIELTKKPENNQKSLLEDNKKDIKTILFLDEIHRFNKAQQDFLLPYVENGTITLIGATTENPSFEVISALLSRCRVYTLKPHLKKDLKKIINRTLKNVSKGLGKQKLDLTKDALEFLIISSNGDPRTALNTLEMTVKLLPEEKKLIKKPILEEALQHKALLYDKHGEEHYNLISALHKSMRSSDPNAAVYWTARMLEAGEDPLYLARRMLRFASEDIGNADPQALHIANSVFEACEKIGMPECNVFLSQLAIYLSKAPKDNTAYIAYNKAKADAKQTLNLPVPLHLRNAPTKLMENIGYGKGYIYDHDVDGKKSGQQCLPDKLKNKKYVKSQ